MTSQTKMNTTLKPPALPWIFWVSSSEIATAWLGLWRIRKVFSASPVGTAQDWVVKCSARTPNLERGKKKAMLVYWTQKQLQMQHHLCLASCAPPRCSSNATLVGSPAWQVTHVPGKSHQWSMLTVPTHSCRSLTHCAHAATFLLLSIVWSGPLASGFVSQSLALDALQCLSSLLTKELGWEGKLGPEKFFVFFLELLLATSLKGH